MPMQGQWRRTNAPLGRRERLVVIWGVVATAVVVAVLIVATAGVSRPAPAPGCIRAQIAGVMGASELNLCGARAKRACEQAAGATDPNSQAIRSSCHDARLLD